MDYKLPDGITSVDVSRQYQTFVSKVIAVTREADTQSLLVPITDSNKEINGISFSERKLDVLLLIILLHYTSVFGPWKEYLFYEIELELTRKQKYPGLKACIHCKSLCFLLILYNKISARTLYGNILKKDFIERVLSKLHFKYEKFHYPRRAIRRRGYNDKGSRHADHEWLPKQSIEFDLEQSRKESRQEAYDRLTTFLIRKAFNWEVRFGSLLKGEIY